MKASFRLDQSRNRNGRAKIPSRSAAVFSGQ
jgi:hypothetical protein